MSCNPTINRRVAPVSPKRRADLDPGRATEPDAPPGLPDRLLGRTDDKLHRQYLLYFYDPDVLPRIKAVAKLLAYRMNARRSRGSAEFQHEADDLINNVFVLLCARRTEFACKMEFCKAFAQGMENYNRWRRRSQQARAHLDGPLEETESRVSQQQAYVFSFPSPESHTSDRRDLEMVHRAVLAEAPDLERLLLAILSGYLKPADLRTYLELDHKVLEAQRKRLNRLARRTLKRER